jgi:hypothetical protein
MLGDGADPAEAVGRLPLADMAERLGAAKGEATAPSPASGDLMLF